MYHMTPEVSDFVLGFLEDRYKHIEVAHGSKVTVKQKGQVWIKMCDDNRDPFLATLHNVLLEPNLRDRLISIIKSMNFGLTCLFHKGFCTVYFRAKDKNAFTLPQIAQRIHAFLRKIKEMLKTKKLPSRKKIAL